MIKNIIMKISSFSVIFGVVGGDTKKIDSKIIFDTRIVL